MEPVGFILGILTFGVAAQFKKPIRKAAVFTASQAIGLTNQLKSTAYGFKEEIEDIIAEAQYENMKRNMEKVEALHKEFDQHHREH